MDFDKRFLALGDSYTIGESVSADERWPVQLVTRLQKLGLAFHEPLIVATTGWRTDELKSAIVAADLFYDYDLVSLSIGVNNQYQNKSVKVYEKEFEELLNMAIEHAYGHATRVFVLSIPDYGYTPFGREKQAEISKGIDEFNKVNRTVSEKYKVKYFNVTGISRRGLLEPELVATDGLHPSGQMYREWVDIILEDEDWLLAQK